MTSQTLGTYITSCREKMGISRNALAVACDISRTEIIRIEEGGRKQPSLIKLQKIAAVLGCNYDMLLRLAGYIPLSAESPLEFVYPTIDTEQKRNFMEEIVRIISENPQFTDEDFDKIIFQAKLIAIASKESAK